MSPMKKQLVTQHLGAALLGSLLWGCAPTPAQETPAPRLGPNLVQNPGFENGVVGWSIPAGTATLNSALAHTGQNSLHYTNTDPKNYKFFRQKLAGVKPGQHLHFSVWAKGENLTAKGATLYVQSLDVNNKYINGSYPPGIPGTHEWRQVKDEFIVPDNAASTWVLLYLHRNATGTAWFDDVDVRVEQPATVETFLRFPNYRGQVKQGDSTTWKTDLRFNSLPEWKDGNLQIESTLADAAGKALVSNTHSLALIEASTLLTLDPPANLPVGTYSWKQTVKGPDGHTISQQSHPIHVVTALPKVYIDSEGFTVVNGERFFPLGMYLGNEEQTSAEHFTRMTEGGFNTVLNYGYGYREKDPEAYLERAAKHKLKVIYSTHNTMPGLYNGPEPANGDSYSVAADYVRRMRDKEALLAWYINDERSPGWLPKLQKLHGLTTELDPNHPTFQVLANSSASALEKYFKVTDVLGNDPYPVGRESDLTATSHHTRITVEAGHGGKGTWMVPQMMDWSVYRPELKQHSPSRDELRNQAYQAIINGAKGLIFYTYYDMMYEKFPRTEATKNPELFKQRWEQAAAMGREINALIPAILHGVKAPLTLPANARVEANALTYNGELLILLANPYYSAEKLTLSLPQGWKIAQAKQGHIESTVQGNQVTFQLPSVGSGVFRLMK